MQRKEPTPGAYIRASAFLRILRGYRHILTVQEFRTLRGQAVSGDIDGAMRGLGWILERKRGSDR